MATISNFDDINLITAVKNSKGDVTLAYIAVNRQDDLWQVATKEEFLKGYNYDEITSYHTGITLERDDIIYCDDGFIMGYEILKLVL